MKHLYTPFGITFGVIGGLIGGQIFKQIWKLVAGEDDAPSAKESEYGWKEVLPLMKIGDNWQVFLPPEKAYGMRGQGPIGPNEPLVFDIKLIDVK